MISIIDPSNVESFPAILKRMHVLHTGQSWRLLMMMMSVVAYFL